MRSGFTHFFYAERYVERFTAAQCSEKLVTMHNESLRIREDLGPSLLYASPAELPTLNNRIGRYLLFNAQSTREGHIRATTLEERGTTLVKTLKRERSIVFIGVSWPYQK